MCNPFKTLHPVYLFYYCFLYCKSSHLIVQQFFIEANVHGVEGSSSARPIVFVRVHVQLFLSSFLSGDSLCVKAFVWPEERRALLFNSRERQEGAII